MTKTIFQLIKEDSTDITDPIDFASTERITQVELPTTVTIEPTQEDPDTIVSVAGAPRSLSFVKEQIENYKNDIVKRIDERLQGYTNSWGFLAAFLDNKVFRTYVDALAEHYDTDKKESKGNSIE